jgi:hypothetical protein
MYRIKELKKRSIEALVIIIIIIIIILSDAEDEGIM